MPNIKLTDKTVNSLSAKNKKRTEYWDFLLPGFGLRVSETNKKSWVILYRLHGRKRRMTLGRYPMISLATARDMARNAFEKIERGIDPADEKKQNRAIRPQTFEDLADAYIKYYAKPRKKSWKDDESVLRLEFIPTLKNKSADCVTRADIKFILSRMINRGVGARANRALATIRKVFNWAIDEDILESTPVLRIKKPFRERSRDRVLTENEIKNIWIATEKLIWPWNHFTKVLILTL